MFYYAAVSLMGCGCFSIMEKSVIKIELDVQNEELLNYMVSEGIIDLSSVREQLEMAKKKEYLAKHQFQIWQGKDGKWRTYLPDKEKERRLVKKSTREAIEDAIVEYYKRESENPTIRDVFEEWNNRRLELQKISKATHMRNQQFFDRHYLAFGQRKIKSVSEDEWQNFLEEQIPQHNLSSKAFAGLKGITKGLLKRAKKRKLINYNIDEMFGDLDVSDVEFKKIIKEDYEEVYDEEESDKIIGYLRDNLDCANIGILLMFVTGIRVGDDDDKIRLNQRKPSKYKGLSRFGPEKNLQRINKFMKERPIFYKNLIQMKENFRFYLRCFYCITKVVILQFNSENRTELARNG